VKSSVVNGFFPPFRIDSVGQQAGGESVTPFFLSTQTLRASCQRIRWSPSSPSSLLTQQNDFLYEEEEGRAEDVFRFEVKEWTS